MRALLQWYQYSIAGEVPRRSLMVALLVGTILNVINQGDQLVAGDKINFIKIILTYIVPYCVATYGAVSYRIGLERAALDDRNDCKNA
ncbi:MAG: nitrate/nitrite transporter NrtS [Acidiphilium sp.]